MDTKKISAGLILLTAFLPGPAAPACDYPPEVQKFIVSRENCDTLRGEEPPDKKTDLEQWIKDTNQTCSGLDKRLLSLNKKYKNNRAISRKLRGFELLDATKQH